MKRIVAITLTALMLPPLVLFAWLTLTESGLNWIYGQAEGYLPGELTVTSLEGRLIGPVSLKGLEYQQEGMRVKLDQAILDWSPIELLAANIDISRLHVQALDITLPQSEKTDQPVTLPEIHLPWRLSLNAVSVDDITINRGEQRFALQQISLDANTVFSKIDIERLNISGEGFNLTLSGELRPRRLYRHDINIAWQARLPSGEMVQGKGQLAGNLKSTRIQQQLSAPVQVSLDAKVHNLLEQLNWEARVNVSSFDLAKLNTEWPALNGNLQLQGQGDLTTATVSGSMDGEHVETGPIKAQFKLQGFPGDTIKIDQLSLLSAVNNTQLNARGEWLPGPEGGNIALSLHWQNLRWPINSTAWFDSAIGSGWIAGDLKHYRLGLATDRPWPEAPPSFWYASADGDLNGLDFHSLRVSALDGEARAKGQLSWSPQLIWQAEANADNINPGALWPQWPAQLKASLTSAGRIENGQLQGSADITQLNGTLRGYPVTLNSRLGWHNNGLDIDHFDFHSGGSRVKANGRVADDIALEWTVDASELSELYPGAGGQFKAEGKLGGSQSAPQLSARLRGQALQLNGYAVQSLTINTDAGNIEAEVVTDKLTATLELKGKVENQGWQGRIERADLVSQQFQDWQLEAPASLNLNANSLSLAPLCWLSNNSKVCITSQRETENWQATLKAAQVPLVLLTPFLPEDLQLEGIADANAEIRYQASAITGEASISLPPGSVSYPLLQGERDQWEYTGGTLDISLNEQGINARSELSISNGDRFQASLELPGAQLLTLDQQQSLRGNAQLRVHDLGLISALIPEVENLKGEVELNLAATGTLAQPMLSGDAKLNNGTLQVPRLGLNINQLSLRAQSDSLERLSFHLDARSGEGMLNLAGQTLLDKTAGWPTTMTIKGENIEVSRIPEARVLVSPDLRVSLKQRTIRIEGGVHVPYAKLQPKDITTAARVSEDVVIIGGEQPPVEKWNIFTEVRLTLGERVNFFGFGFEGRFGGSLLLHDEPGQLTTATGELNVLEGRYRAYGQRLDVEYGRLLYTGGPLSNPGLDIRAVRHVGNVTAGLKVWGSLNQPQIELFSIPAMGQTDALAYLMLGRPIENASGEDGAMMAKAVLALGLSGGDNLARRLGDRFGLDEMRVEANDTGEQASLVMGRYLSPKLYVSYGVGLVEAFNTFSVRYQISEKWQLKGESGEYQGADLIYTIER